MAQPARPLPTPERSQRHRPQAPAVLARLVADSQKDARSYARRWRVEGGAE